MEEPRSGWNLNWYLNLVLENICILELYFSKIVANFPYQQKLIINVSELSKSSSRWDTTSHPIFSRQPRLNECLVQCQRLFVGVTFQCFHMLRSRMSDWAFLLIFHFIKQYSDIKLPWFSSQHRTESDFKQTSSSPYYRNEGKLLNVSMLTCWVRQNLPDDK